MYRVFSETMGGIRHRDPDRTPDCACGYKDVGDYSVFAVAEYLVPSPLTAGITAQEMVNTCLNTADEQLFCRMFADGYAADSRYFEPIFTTADKTVEKDSTKVYRSRMNLGIMIVEKSTMRAKVAVRGNIHIVSFNKITGKYEYAWPRFGGVTAMWAMTEFHIGYNVLISNEAFFRMLHNEKENRLYMVYEDMLLHDLDQTFNLKSLEDRAYIAVDLSGEEYEY